MTLDIKKLTYFRFNERGEREEVDTFTGDVVHVASDLLLEDLELKRYPYSSAVASIIAGEIRKGETIQSLSQKQGFPSASVLYKWKQQHEDFRQMLQMAVEDRADVHHDKINTMAEHAASLDKDEVPAYKLAIETRKWLAEKDNPSKYGSKTTVTGEGGGPLVINVVTGINRDIDVDLDESIPAKFRTILEKEYAEVRQDETDVKTGTGSGEE